MHLPRLLHAHLIGLFIAICASSAFGGAWTAAKGAFYGKISYGASSANDQYGFDGVTKPLVEGVTDYPFADRSFYLYCEYGYTDELTITAMVPFKRVFVHDKIYKYSTSGIADVAVGARYLIFNKDGWVGSASGSLSVPAPYHRDYQPPLGAGQVDIAVAANIGRSLWPLPMYATGSLGFRYRTGIYTSQVSANATQNPFFHDSVNYSNEMFYMAEAGYTFFDHLLVHGVLSGLFSLRSNGVGFSINSMPSTQAYLKAGGGMALGLFDHYEVSADVYTSVFGTNTSKSIDIFLGAGVKF